MLDKQKRPRLVGGKWWFGIEWDFLDPECKYPRKAIYPFNWLSPKYRYLGYWEDWHDGPLPHVGLWFFNVSWQGF